MQPLCVGQTGSPWQRSLCNHWRICTDRAFLCQMMVSYILKMDSQCCRGQSMQKYSAIASGRLADCSAAGSGLPAVRSLPRPRIVLAHLPDWIALLTFCREHTTIWSHALSLADQAWQKMTLWGEGVQKKSRGFESACYRESCAQLRMSNKLSALFTSSGVYICDIRGRVRTQIRGALLHRRLLNVGDALDRTPFQGVPPRIKCPAGGLVGLVLGAGGRPPAPPCLCLFHSSVCE